MSSANVTINCTPEVFFENHVDFEHFVTVHQGYSDPKLINVSWTSDEFKTLYSLIYGKRFKQTIVYDYTVRQIDPGYWQGTIETRSHGGMMCRLTFDGRQAGDQTAITVTVQANAWWMTSAMCKAMEQTILKTYLGDFAADKAEIDGKTGRFPKPVLADDDVALREFRKFAQCAA